MSRKAVRLKPWLTLDDLTHRLRTVEGLALVEAPGRSPLCLLCQRTGHIHRDCCVSKCSGGGKANTEHVMDEADAEGVAASAVIATEDIEEKAKKDTHRVAPAELPKMVEATPVAAASTRLDQAILCKAASGREENEARVVVSSAGVGNTSRTLQRSRALGGDWGSFVEIVAGFETVSAGSSVEAVVDSSVTIGFPRTVEGIETPPWLAIQAVSISSANDPEVWPASADVSSPSMIQPKTSIMNASMSLLGVAGGGGGGRTKQARRGMSVEMNRPLRPDIYSMVIRSLSAQENSEPAVWPAFPNSCPRPFLRARTKKPDKLLLVFFHPFLCVPFDSPETTCEEGAG
ncbi:hypothetical protein HPB47_019045 [Ixodes persulcatus]|uniref:Uncharacterized protein n=1 Tax=Ixodes persulcatus TaxID=34615 RepID=A0AC60QL38_IXOPE|nr:hypothetical protein HPB47_019045 [Ixodes persulcatus]